MKKAFWGVQLLGWTLVLLIGFLYNGGTASAFTGVPKVNKAKVEVSIVVDKFINGEWTTDENKDVGVFVSPTHILTSGHITHAMHNEVAHIQTYDGKFYAVRLLEENPNHDLAIFEVVGDYESKQWVRVGIFNGESKKVVNAFINHVLGECHE